MESNGSVIPLWKSQIAQNKPITITDPEITRFMMSKDQAINLILKCAYLSKGAEVFILKMPAVKIGDLAEIIIEKSGKKVDKKIIGIKPGETKYEELMSKYEAERAIETPDAYIISSQFEEYFSTNKFAYPNATKIKTLSYDSNSVKPMTKGEIKNNYLIFFCGA